MLPALLALVGCAAVNEIVPIGDAYPMRPTASALWTDGPWYDTGDIARLLLSSGTVSCLDLQDIALETDENSTLFNDEGILMTLRRTRLEPESGAEPPSWLGEWAPSGELDAWRWTLEATAFFGGYPTGAQPDEDAWLSVASYDGGGTVDGSLATRDYTAVFEVEHCGEMRTYIYY